MPTNVVVKPELLKWARQRVNFDADDLAHALRIKNTATVEEWERTGQLKLGQLERIAQKTYTPIGYLFLSEPPEEKLPIPDYRTLNGKRATQPSPNLLDSIYYSQFRQDWYRDALVASNADPVSFVGTASTEDDPIEIANRIRATVRLDRVDRTKMPTWEETLRMMIEKVEEAGIIVMRNGVVGNNTHRKLDVKEFRGFSLSDDFAPVIFINAADAKSAQMFTLAHELTHIWLGQSGVSNTTFIADRAVEAFCNKVAAELLIPTQDFLNSWQKGRDASTEVERLARMFKVSTLVVLIRAYEAGVIKKGVFQRLYDEEKSRHQDERGLGGGGGDFYRTQRSRLSKTFISRVISSTLEGHTTYTEAFQLLGVRKSQTFHKLAETVLGD